MFVIPWFDLPIAGSANELRGLIRRKVRYCSVNHLLSFNSWLKQKRARTYFQDTTHENLTYADYIWPHWFVGLSRSKC